MSTPEPEHIEPDKPRSKPPEKKKVIKIKKKTNVNV